MTEKTLTVIKHSIIHTKTLIENLACECYPFTDFEDQDIRDMFYNLNDMCLLLSKKIEDLT